MDLPHVERYLRPTSLDSLPDWQPGWSWLAGGSWIFSEPDTQARVLVDLESLGWSAFEILPTGFAIGATCKLIDLLKCDVPPAWTSTHALRRAVEELASFKIWNTATIGGNLCLALPAGTFAPVMVVLDAHYEILQRHASAAPLYQSRWVAAADFQTGARQTLLQPGEVLRKIQIPLTSLGWRVSYHRMCIATAGIAIAIVVAAYDPQTKQVRFGIGASTAIPKLLTFATPPTPPEIATTLHEQIAIADFIQDAFASASYRQHITQVLIKRALADVLEATT